MDPKNASDADNSKRDEAAGVVRDTLDAIYENQPKQAQADQHHQNHAQTTHANHWQRYHTEWQNYYQKYYEQYYVGHLHHVLKEKAEEQARQEEAKKTPEEKRDEDILNLRQKIVLGAKSKAKRARKSRHFIPAMSAIVVMLVVAFLQYNEVLFANVQAFVSPGAIDPQNIVVDPTASVQVSPDPKLIIPKI